MQAAKIFAAMFACFALMLTTQAQAQSTAPAPNGAAIFKMKCAACHAVTPGKAGVGPTLFGVVNRQVASVKGFAYSAALVADKTKWSATSLDIFLKAPTKIRPGTRMTVPVTDDAQRRALIEYLSSLK